MRSLRITTFGALLLTVAACSSSGAGASAVVSALGPGGSFAVLHAKMTVTGGLTVSGSYDDQLSVATCAAVAEHGTTPATVNNGDLFYVPNPMQSGGNPGSIGGSNSFETDVAATYKGPGSYSGSQVNGTEMWVNPIAGDQETHNFAPVNGLGSMTVSADASGSYDFSGWQDPGSVVISGTVTWTCSDKVAKGRLTPALNCGRNRARTVCESERGRVDSITSCSSCRRPNAVAPVRLTCAASGQVEQARHHVLADTRWHRPRDWGHKALPAVET